MPNQRQPVDLIDYKGLKNLTKEELARRRAEEVHAPSGNVQAPKYLNRKQREEFEALAQELEPLGILANVDAGELARYCVAHDLYARYTKRLQQAPRKKAVRMRREAEEKGEPLPEGVSDDELALELEESLVKLQHKYFEQCEQTARALGLNITSRCRLIVPKAPEPPASNKFERFEKRGSAG